MLTARGQIADRQAIRTSPLNYIQCFENKLNVFIFCLKNKWLSY